MHDVTKRWLDDFIDGSPTPELEAHVAACSECRSVVQHTRALAEMLREFRPVSPMEVPLGFAPRVIRSIGEQKSRSFWTVFSVYPAFATKLALGSLLSLAILGSYLATQSSDTVASADHTPEAVMGSHDFSDANSPQHLDGMLVTLATYHR